MGRMLGSFADDNELDRPDLNKCPDCKCYFAGETCPLCGKVCPEEMRAGNRKPVKVKKYKNRSQSGRVTFVSWYYSWWFILLMFWFFPLIGIILLISSPYKKWLKIVLISLAIVYSIFVTWGLGGRLLALFDQPVDTSLSAEEYVAACQEVSPESFYRSPDTYQDDFVTMTLVITGKFTDSEAYDQSGKNITYYTCQSINGGAYEIMLRECIQDGATNYMPGDVIVIYGEGDGIRTVYDMNYNLHTLPCINIAYAVLVQE